MITSKELSPSKRIYLSIMEYVIQYLLLEYIYIYFFLTGESSY